MKFKNITLIGMPGSGKSFYGKLLAKKLNFKFIDGDEYIKKQEKMKLQEIIDKKGNDEFLKIEERRNLELFPLKKYVFAPGGSVIYSRKLMDILKKSSTIVFLNAPFNVLKKRLTNKTTRGIVFKSQSLEELYKERVPLYKKYSDIIINYSRESDNEIIKEIIQKLNKYK